MHVASPQMRTDLTNKQTSDLVSSLSHSFVRSLALSAASSLIWFSVLRSFANSHIPVA